VLTVLLATKNRIQILLEVLESYCKLAAPASGWKLVIVDNGSTDGTFDIVCRFATRLPLHVIREPKQGKNSALNKGIELAEGDLIVLTDDDAFPSPDWLVQLRKVADEQVDYSIFGGVVKPHWEISPPSWAQWIDLGPTFTVTDPTLEEGPIEAHHVFGPNMAIRMSTFQAGARFDSTIGPNGSNYAMGSETELVLRLASQGHKAWHAKDAVVGHYIRREQLDLHWVFQRGVRFGRGQYRLYRQREDANVWSIFGIPIYLFRRALKQAVLAGFDRIFLDKKSYIGARWRLNVLIGQMIEAGNVNAGRKMSRSSHPELAVQSPLREPHSLSSEQHNDNQLT